MQRRFVVIGGGQAGGQAAKTLRAYAPHDQVTLIGEEEFLPYERPPLSKEILLGSEDADFALMESKSFYQEQRIELRLGVHAARIDRSEQLIHFTNGEQLAYDSLLVATGARVRRLDITGAELNGVYYLRTLDDAIVLRDRFALAQNVVVIGGGFIGLEAAAVARERGCNVTVLERAKDLLNRVAAPEVGAALRRLHEGRGVKIHTGVEIQKFTGSGSISGILCSDGLEIPADVVIVGIGVVPNAELAEQAGLQVSNGIVVNQFCQSSDPTIYAAGDVANCPNALLGFRVRLESWQNAQNQAIIAARAMTGATEPHAEIPWFWSNQYDSALQMLGVPREWDRLVFRGDPKGRSFTCFYILSGIVVGVNTLNNSREIRTCRQLMLAGHIVDLSLLSNPNVPLKSLLIFEHPNTSE